MRPGRRKSMKITGTCQFIGNNKNNYKTFSLLLIQQLFSFLIRLHAFSKYKCTCIRFFKVIFYVHVDMKLTNTDRFADQDRTQTAQLHLKNLRSFRIQYFNGGIMPIQSSDHTRLKISYFSCLAEADLGTNNALGTITDVASE